MGWVDGDVDLAVKIDRPFDASKYFNPRNLLPIFDLRKLPNRPGKLEFRPGKSPDHQGPDFLKEPAHTLKIRAPGGGDHARGREFPVGFAHLVHRASPSVTCDKDTGFWEP